MIDTTDREGHDVTLVQLEGDRWHGCYSKIPWNGGWFRVNPPQDDLNFQLADGRVLTLHNGAVYRTSELDFVGPSCKPRRVKSVDTNPKTG